jgi:DNA polymerase-4
LISRSRTVAGTIGSNSDLTNLTAELLKALFPKKKAVRLLGISVSGFIEEVTDAPEQIALEL